MLAWAVVLAGMVCVAGADTDDAQVQFASDSAQQVDHSQAPAHVETEPLVPEGIVDQPQPAEAPVVEAPAPAAAPVDDEPLVPEGIVDQPQPEAPAVEAPTLEPASVEEVVPESEPEPQPEEVVTPPPAEEPAAPATVEEEIPESSSEEAGPVEQPVEEVVPVLPPEALDADGPRYQITKLIISYAEDHPALPPVEDLGDVAVDLLLTQTGYAAVREGVGPVRRVRLGDIDNERDQITEFWFHASAFRRIAQAIVEDLNERGYIGVFVAPHPEDIEDGEDIRDPDNTSLRVTIRTVVVTQLRTLGSGDRLPEEDRINNPVHQRLKDQSPVQPAAEGQAQREDLLRKDLLDDYLFQLNRHAGRRVDVAVSRAPEHGGIVLDYLITENSPWLAYFQISNTGTKQTREWRERFGLVQNQLTGRDDVLSLDYVTAGFDKSHSLSASYDALMFDNQKFKWRIFGSWSEFTASDVGVSTQQFEGQSWSLGAELIPNLVQDRETFLDLILGVRHEHIFVDNQGINEGTDDFFIPYIGLSLERIVEIASTSVLVTVERNAPGVANTEVTQIGNFGRTGVEDRWTLLKWNASHSFYLEPTLNYEAWSDITKPDTATLAHEVALSFKGQHSFSARLIPQFEQVAGGLYSVRGYAESATAGDTVFIGSVEYRYHIPRAFQLEPNPSKTPLFGKPFRFAPQQVYGRPDWDLILRGFFDAAYVIKSDRVLATEDDERLFGTGFGLELQFQRNVNVRVDWGFALEDAGEVQAGSSQVHIVATLLF